MVESAVVEAKGKPQSSLAAGDRKILTWPDLRVVLRKGVVVEASKLTPKTNDDVDIKEAGPAINADDPEKWTFDLTEVDFRWYRSRGVSGEPGLLSPQVSFTVRNRSSSPIAYLKLKFVFLKDENRIFDEAIQYAIGTSDTPLEKDFISKRYFVRTSIGYVPQKVPFGGPFDADTLRGYNADEIQSSASFRVVVYAMQSTGGTFEKFGEFTWRGKWWNSR